MNIIFILIFGSIWLFSIVKSFKPMYTIYNQKAYLGVKLFELKSISDYFWIFILPIAFIFITGWNKKYGREHFEIYNFFNFSLTLVFFITFFYSSFQRRSLWSGGIVDPSIGVLKWEEIISFSFVKEGPYKYENMYPWSPNKYILTFNFLKTSKLGDEVVEVSWKVKEIFAAKIIAILQEKLSAKEITPIVDTPAPSHQGR